MASLLCHLHFWTFKTLYPGTASGSDIGHHVYHDKAAVPLEGVIHTARKEWAEGRGITWLPSSKKPEKLRDTLKECEELLSSHHPVAMKWKGTRHCLVVLDNGVLITYTVAHHSGDIENIFIDKSLVSRIGAKIDKAVIMSDSIVVTIDGQKLCHIMSTRKRASLASYHNPLTLTNTDSGRRLEKLSVQDLKLSYLNLEGVPSDQVSCQLLGSDRGDMMALWWREEMESGWGRATASSSRSNFLLFTFKEARIQYQTGLQTEGIPITMEFSNAKRNTIYSLEKIGPSEYKCITYEFVQDKIKVGTSSPIESRASIKICARNRNESVLLLGCEDNTLILHNSAIAGEEVKKTKAIVTPVSVIKWHPTGTVAFVCSSSGGNIQCYDLGLNCLFFQLLSEDPAPERPVLLMIGSHFVAPVHLQLAEWASHERGEEKEGSYDNFMMIFDRGPLVLLRIELGVLSRGNLRPFELVSEYIQQNDIEKGLSVLKRLDWDFQHDDAFSCLTILTNHLLVQPFTSQTERFIEAALATFNISTISASIMSRYKRHVVNLKRRFFFLLLRFKRLLKAFEIAQDVRAQDLFMDVHFQAAHMNDHELAEKAKQAADDLSSESALALSWTSFSRPDRAMSYSPTASPLSGDGTYLQPSSTLHSDDDIRQALQAISSLSFSFDSLTSSFSTSPLMEQEQATSDHSATPHSELEDYSDNEATQEAEQIS